MLTRSVIILLLFLSVSPVVAQSSGIGPVFEPVDVGYEARTTYVDVHIESNVLRLSNRTSNREESLTWIKASGQISGTSATGGVTNYAIGTDPKTWKMGVPHYSRVRNFGLYPGIDVEYYFSEGRPEFDLILTAGADPKLPRYSLSKGSTLSLNDAGELVVRSPEGDYNHRAPRAYQRDGDSKREIGCRYVLYPDQTVGFELDFYDASLPLIIDPIIDFMTYLGGNNQDLTLALDVDSSGNLVFGGITNSSNFPGLWTSNDKTSIFVAKLNSTGTAVLFTTLLGTTNLAPDQGVKLISGLDVDALGDIYITGENVGTDFPVTPGAYRPSGFSYAAKLSPTGEIRYSTFLDEPVKSAFAPTKIHAYAGAAYIAGTIQLSSGFMGTADAYQKQVLGRLDSFVLALKPDGSGLLFSTAFGGLNTQMTLTDMALDSGGNVVLVGSSIYFASASSSNPMPVTNSEVAAPIGGESAGFVARLNSQGSQLLNFGWLGRTTPTGVVVGSDGSFIIAGYGTLPAGLAAMQQRPFTVPPPGQPSGYILKRSMTDQTLWVTGVRSDSINASGSLTMDSEGSLYWVTNYSVDDFGYESGGAFYTAALALPPDLSPPPPGIYTTGPSLGINKLSADGKTLLYASRVPVVYPSIRSNRYSLRLAAGSNGIVFGAGTTAAANWPTTPGVIQGSRDPAPWSPSYPSNSDDGIFFRLDLHDFSTSNFFFGRRTGQTNSVQLRWRLGEPAPASVTFPVYLSGSAVVEAIPSEGITAVMQQDPSVVALNVDPPAFTSAGTYQRTVDLHLQGVANSSLALPVSVTILPRVVFELAQTEVEIRFRKGQQRTLTNIPITSNVVGFIETQSSDRTWLYDITSGTNLLQISVGNLPVGTYEGTITVTLTGEQVSSVRRVVNVRYVVEPAAVLNVPTAPIFLDVVKGQPVTPVKIPVASTPPNVPYSVFVGTYPAGFTVTQASNRTPGEIDVRVNSDMIAPGSYQISIFVNAEDAPRAEIKVSVNVAPNPSGSDPRFTAWPPTCDGSGLGTLSFQWNAPGFGDVQIRVGSPDGPWMTGALPPSGSTSTGPWVTPGMKFYLIAMSSGQTISSITASVACGVLTSSPIICMGPGLGKTTIAWYAPGWSDLTIRVGAIDGVPLTGLLGSSGTVDTGPWVTNDMEFFLVTASGDLLARRRVTIPNTCSLATITASQVSCTGNLGKTTLSWFAPSVAEVRVLVGDFPDGPLLAMYGTSPQSGFSGSTETGPWVTNGMKFTLATPYGAISSVTVPVSCP